MWRLFGNLSIDNNYFIVIFFSLLGIIFGIFRRGKQKWKRNNGSIFNIIFNDYSFKRYAIIPLITLIYAVLQGALIGAVLGFLLRYLDRIALELIVGTDIAFQYWDWEDLVYALYCFFLIFVLRISLEVVIITYKTASDLSNVSNLFSKYLVGKDPSIEDDRK